MIEWIKRLAVLGVEFPIQMSMYLTLESLFDSSNFIVNFNVNKIKTFFAKLLKILTTAKGPFRRKSLKFSFFMGTTRRGR